MTIAALWRSAEAREWSAALEHYRHLIKPRNLELERRLDALTLDRIRGMEPAAWFAFLHDEYFRWKYTAPNRYGSTTKLLRRFVEMRGDGALDEHRSRLLGLDLDDIAGALAASDAIPGLGIAGGSGLLALMYPSAFGTVDQFAVKALCRVEDLAEAAALKRMNPEALRIGDGVLLVGIMRRKATELTRALGAQWTPRMVDKVLWAVDRPARDGPRH